MFPVPTTSATGPTTCGADTESLLADGWTLELAANAPEEGYGRFTYVRSPSGYLVEPVSLAHKPRFERWWAGRFADRPGARGLGPQS